MTVAGPARDLPGGRHPPAPRAILTTAWTVSAGVLALIALSALWRTVTMAGSVLGNLPAAQAAIAAAIAAIAVLGSVGLIAAARRTALRTSAPGGLLPLLIVALAVTVRVAVALVVDPSLFHENRIVHEQALAVLDGGCCFSHRPLGYPIVLAGAYAVLGIGPPAVEGLNIAFAAVTAWLVWEIGRATWGRGAAAVAATAYAVVPSQVLLAVVPLTEPLYTLLVAGAVRAAIALERRPALLAAAVAATLVAAAQYVRATAALLLGPIILLPWVEGWRAGPAFARAALIGAIFALLLLPVAAYNLRAHGDLSVSTSAYGGWSLYVGVNREYGGQWNPEDASRLASFPGDTWWARSEHAGGLVADRILEDAAGSLRLVPTKFSTLWGDESYAADYALSRGATSDTVQIAWLTSQVAWLGLTMLAAVGMWASRHEPRPAAMLIGMTVVLVAVTHLALEVHSRYHASVVPLLCLLAAGGAEAILARWVRHGTAGRGDRHSSVGTEVPP